MLAKLQAAKLSRYLKGSFVKHLDSIKRCSTAPRKAKVLVFGGNGFLGSSCARTLIMEGHDITLIHRGKSHWDYSSVIKPYVKEIVLDRRTDEAVNYYKSLPSKSFDVAIDFTAYRPYAVEDALLNLQTKIGSYILISSDSVYEVCEEVKSKLYKEDDAIRPECLADQRQLNDEDELYGHNKLSSEKLLGKADIPYTILRLPDIIGPKDTTHRWWPFQAWMEVYSQYGNPLVLPKKKDNITSSYVYVNDVANAVGRIVSDILAGSHESDVFNLGFIEGMSLRDVLNSMQEALNINCHYTFEKEDLVCFPSVKFGSIDASKAREKLNWQPTPWKQAVKETVSFYQRALGNFDDERLQMVRRLSKIVNEDIYEVVDKVNKYLKSQYTGKYTLIDKKLIKRSASHFRESEDTLVLPPFPRDEGTEGLYEYQIRVRSQSPVIFSLFEPSNTSVGQDHFLEKKTKQI